MSNHPARVLHILGELRPSGAESMLRAAASEFAKYGFVSEILSTGPEPGPFSGPLMESGYLVHHLPFSKSPRFFLGLLQLMRGHYDVVHLHMERANFWVALTAVFAGTPVVLRTIHSSFEFTGALRLRRGIQRRILHRMGVRQIAVGESVQSAEARRFGLKAELIHNWYDSDRLFAPAASARQRARAALQLSEQDFVVASVGNCGPAKNHGAFIEALAMLPPDSRPTYLHVGIEQQGCPERVMAEKMRVADRIRFLGHVSDVRSVLHAADAFVMPSLYEGCGIAALEAMAVGLPIIATDVPGLKDFRKRFSGIIYAKADARSLSEALSALVALPGSVRSEMAREYPAIARKCYGIEAGVTKYVNVYAINGGR